MGGLVAGQRSTGAAMRISEISEYSQGVATDGAAAVEVPSSVVPMTPAAEALMRAARAARVGRSGSVNCTDLTDAGAGGQGADGSGLMRMNGLGELVQVVT